MRQEVSEGNPYVSQKLRVLGTQSTAGRPRVFMFSNKKMQIDYLNC